MDQLHSTRTERGLGLVRVLCGDECKDAVRNGKGQVYRLPDQTVEMERVRWLQGDEQRERESVRWREKDKPKFNRSCSVDQLGIVFCLTEDAESAVRQHVPAGVPHDVVALVCLRDSLGHPELPALLQPTPAGMGDLQVGAVPKHDWHGLFWSSTGRKLQQGSIFRNVLLKVFPVVPLERYYAIWSNIKDRRISAKLLKYYDKSVRLEYLKLST